MPELKLRTINQTAADVLNSGIHANSYVQCMNLIGAGTGANERLGQEVTWKSMTMHMLFTHSADFPPTQFHLMFYWVRDWNAGASDLANNIFTWEDNGTVPNAAMDLSLCPVSSAQMRRYRLIYSKRFIVGNSNLVNTTGDGKAAHHHRKVRLNLKSTVTRYVGTGGAITDINHNCLLMRLISSEATAAANTLTYSCRMRFYDA